MTRKAFTMVELLIVVAIIAIIAAFTIPSFLGGSHQADLNNATQSIVASARDAQSRAATQLKDVSWGIYFSNATNTAPFYAIFSGTTYSTSSVTSVYRLPSTLAFVTSTLPVGSSTSVVFSPVSGAASFGTATSTNISLYVISQPNLSSTITIALSGTISAGGTFSGNTSSSGGSGGGNGSSSLAFGTYLGQLGCASGACAATSTNGGFNGAEHIFLDPSGNIWVGDENNERYEEFNASGTYLTQLGCSSGHCTAGTTNGTFDIPGGGKSDSSGNLYLIDENGERVEKFNSSGSYASQLGCASGACTATSTNGGFYGPTVDAIDSSGDLYVVDELNNRVEEFSSGGTYLDQLGCSSGGCSGSSANGRFSVPVSIAIDPSGNIYVTDWANSRVEKFNSSGTYVSQLGCTSGACTATSTNGGFDGPTGLTTDSSGNVYVADYNNNRVEEFNSTGTYLDQLGCASGACTATSTNGGFDGPNSTSVSSNGMTIYVNDVGNNRVEEFAD